MVNLHSQYLQIKEEIDGAIAQVIDSTQFINGPAVREFEEEFASYLGAKHVISCANGTDALQIALMCLDLQQGDEVITPSFTYAATAEVIGLLGLTPVFVDVDPHTFNIDPNKIEKSISARTKAIIPVHLFGDSANMEALQVIADKYGLVMIEDTAQATGSTYTYSNGQTKKAGTMGNIGTFSFFPSKNLGCFGDGGALCTDDDELAAKARMIARHGQGKKYHHDILGCNSRLDSIQAAVLQVKLKHLETYNDQRRLVADRYRDRLSEVEGIHLPLEKVNSRHVYHQYTIKVDQGREELKDHLQEQGISCMIYYPIPLHKQKAFVNIPVKKGGPQCV